MGTVVVNIADMNTSDDARWYTLQRDSAHSSEGQDPEGELQLQCKFVNADGTPAQWTDLGPASPAVDTATPTATATATATVANPSAGAAPAVVSVAIATPAAESAAE